MNNDLLSDIVITDNDIDWVESLLGNVNFDNCRRDIIKNLESIDIQACPGSGKTTLLVAKLAILANKWPFDNRGICVVSHTNVAREEIEDRLGQTEIGSKLLSYPHYIGTLHSFFDKYISMPWIRSCSIPINIIDSELVLSKRWNKLSYGTKNYLERKRLSEYCCEAKEIPLKFHLGCGENTNTYRNVLSVVSESIKNGEFTFDEMLLYASKATDGNNYHSESIQERFPMLFIDEAQDTSSIQWDLINRLFPDNSLLSSKQSIGDSNQAIFNSYLNDESNGNFPRENALSMQNSKRFGANIARLADALSINRADMDGEEVEFNDIDDKHTIFLFDKSCINSVIPYYAKHILGCFSDDTLCTHKKIGCHVVGMVHKESEYEINDDKFPSSLCDYCNTYNPHYKGIQSNPRFLIEYFRIGKSMLSEKRESSVFYDWIARGLKRYVNINSLTKIGSSSSTFRSFLNAFPIEIQANIRKQMLDISSSKFDNEQAWEEMIAKIKSLCNEHFNIHSNRYGFLDWVEYDPVREDDLYSCSGANIISYTDPENSRSLDLHLSSIHAVKGRTHLSTLVVETYWYSQNIKSILPWLYGEPPQIRQRNATRLKCHYVALSRAKGLVCIAIPSDSVDANIENKLIEYGWIIQRISE